MCFILAAALASSLAVTGSRAQSMTGIRLEKGKRAGTTARSGEMIEIRLPAVPATGYSWQVEAADPKVMALVDTRFENRSAEGPRVGAEVDQVIRMQALAEGQTEIRLSYRRPWEQSAPSADTALLHVTVGK
jgi:predicted secreted protein